VSLTSELDDPRSAIFRYLRERSPHVPSSSVATASRWPMRRRSSFQSRS